MNGFLVDGRIALSGSLERDEMKTAKVIDARLHNLAKKKRVMAGKIKEEPPREICERLNI